MGWQKLTEIIKIEKDMSFFKNLTRRRPSGPQETILGCQKSRKVVKIYGGWGGGRIFSKICPAGGPSGPQEPILGRQESRKVVKIYMGAPFFKI